MSTPILFPTQLAKVRPVYLFQIATLLVPIFVAHSAAAAGTVANKAEE